ncbi:MAG: hypothetical protein MIO93_15070 [ANME-2 cluster archaeon]|nr:hypothetical protein [ANME-2 cluster archaeon]
MKRRTERNTGNTGFSVFILSGAGLYESTRLAATMPPWRAVVAGSGELQHPHPVRCSRGVKKI